MIDLSGSDGHTGLWDHCDNASGPVSFGVTGTVSPARSLRLFLASESPATRTLSQPGDWESEASDSESLSRLTESL